VKPAELLRLSALQQAEAIRSRSVSSVELTQLYLDRIEKYNQTLSAFVSVNERRALKAARKADQARHQKGWNGGPLFHGVPTGIKDLVPVAGTPTRLGSRAYRYFVSPFNGPVVPLLRAGGLISLGKLATSEFGVLPVTEPDIHPPTRNPWDLGRTSGGSSGGSGAAVAADLVPIAHGSDGGGSVRIPSAFCHLFGFKPSLKTLGNLHGRYNLLGISVMGPLARYVEDAAAMIDVMAGRPFGGPPAVSCLAAARHAPRPLKIAMLTASPIGEIDSEILEKTRVAAELLRALGHTVIERDIVKSTLDEFLPVWRFAVSGVSSFSEAILQPVSRWLREKGQRPTLEEAKAVQAILVARIETVFSDADVLLSPTVCTVAPQVGEFVSPEDPETWFRRSSQLGALTATYNLTTGPAASLPLGVTDAGLPYGIQVGARVGQDNLLFSLCKQIEEANPWHHRRAPGFD
jgi:amidase